TPFNPATVIEFDLPRRSNVSITIFNLLGQQVKELVNEEISAGSYRVSWDGILSSGQRASSGIYFYRLIADDFIDTKKMILLK
ncbi:MAG: T9SS type A sorting domain-containing protein, partial [candidate division Zixibacteria bacterium]|nr:T9SS type A sorting domain-containing protein [candidate division Zixibacteria bacterium]